VENASLDHLGTLRFITDQGGQRIGYHEYYPFGVEAFPAGTLSEGSPVQFAGQERDPDPSGGTKGVDYIHARFYDPYVGRFLSTDPLGRRVPMHNPQAYNRFAYTLNNPLSGIDPDGQDNFFVFRPAAHETLPGAGDWGRVERAAAACGHTLTIYTDSNATVGAFNTARETSGSHVTYSGHTVTSATHVAGSVHLADGDVGAFNSDNSNPATPAGNTAASSLAVFGCNSSDLSSQYGSTTFTGVNSGNDGTTTLENLDLAAQAYVLGLIDTSSTAGATRDSDQQLSRSLDPRDAGDHVETFAPTTGPPSTDFDDRDDR
jgi:RHS repeat-associated protein